MGFNGVHGEAQSAGFGEQGVDRECAVSNVSLNRLGVHLSLGSELLDGHRVLRVGQGPQARSGRTPGEWER